MNRMHILGRVALVAVTAVLLAVLAASPAQARKVANPGNVTFVFDSGTLKVGDETFDGASDDEPITFAGTVTESGAVTIPQSSIQFQPMTFEGPTGTVTVNIRPSHPATGTLNPITGQSSLLVRIYIDIDGNLLGDNCRVGTPSNPIVLNLTTGTSGAGANQQTGVPYNTANGRVTLVDGTFAVPGASGCSTFPINVNNEINNQLGLPSPSGNNYARLTASTQPVLQRGVNATFTANPATGPAPLTTTLNAAGSTAKAPATYSWDYTNNGSFEQSGAATTATPTYSTPGTYTARLRVTDADGDFHDTTRQIVVAVPLPDASLQVTPDPGVFTTGVAKGFDVEVTNAGSLPAEGLTVTADMPAGLPATAAGGAGWSCNASGPTVSCTYAGTVAIGEAAPVLRVEATPDGSVIGLVTTDFIVATANDPNPSNDSAQVTSQIIAAGVDLDIDKRHDAEDGLFRGERATYLINVDNEGTLPATARIRVADDLPADVTFRAASGTGWTCPQTGQAVRCFTDRDVAPGEALPTLRIVVDVAPGADAMLDNTATVTVDGDGNLENNTSTDHGFASGYAVDYEVDLSHSGDFLAGEPGTYRIVVRNKGPKTGGNEVGVGALLPDGLVPTAAGGASPEDADAADWTCGISGQTVLCSHPAPVEAGATLETINVTVDVRDEAIGTPVARASVFSDDDPDGGDDEDETLVRSPRPDLAIDKSHEAARFTVGQQGTYRLEVTNTSAEPSRGTTTVTDTLPAGLTYVSATGSGWACDADGQVVTCTSGQAIRGGASSAITLTVAVGEAAAPGVVNVATVQAANDTVAENDRDEDPTAVVIPPRPTKLVAEGAVATIEFGRLRIGLDGVRAKLTSGGDFNGVAGRRIDFRTADGTMICAASTDSTGTARCGTVLLTMLQATLGANYSATFDGDETYAPSRALGGIVHIPQIKVKLF